MKVEPVVGAKACDEPGCDRGVVRVQHPLRPPGVYMQEYACPKCVGRTAKPNLEEKAAALTEAAFKAIFHTGNGTTVEDAYQYWESEWKQELKDEVAAKLRALLVEWE